jgi:succinyl-CoA synthetase beta subunit
LNTDAIQVEVNPLVESSDGRVIAVDAKINVDDNAKFRQKSIVEVAEREDENKDPQEVRATNADLSYIKLNGDIGCMVNGAGLAMATMDIIKLHGGEPANFVGFFLVLLERQNVLSACICNLQNFEVKVACEVKHAIN